MLLQAYSSYLGLITLAYKACLGETRSGRLHRLQEATNFKASKRNIGIEGPAGLKQV
jgi:hypothetical protein